MNLTPIAFVRNQRVQPIDDNWLSIDTEIVLADDIPNEAIAGIEQFSHLEIIYHFHQVAVNEIVWAGHPRGNKAWPYTGIFAQRKKDRPNALGLCTVELLQVKDRCLRVRYLDAIDGTPVLDIKPVFRGFEPKGNIQQPAWVDELMQQYW